MKRKALLFSAYLLGSLSYSLRSAARSCVRRANQVPDVVPVWMLREFVDYHRGDG